MPIVISCTDCNIRMKVPDHVAGKAVRCVKCSKVIRVPAAATTKDAEAESAKKPLKTAAPAAAASSPKKPAAKLATKKPAPEPPPLEDEPDQEEEPPVDEAVEPPEDAPEEKKKTLASDWGKEVLDELDVADDMVKEIQKELARAERIIWAARPRQDILLGHAKSLAVVLGPILVVVGAALLVLGYLNVFGADFMLSVMPMIMGGLFILGGSAVFYRPVALAKNVTRRPCYVLTNRRLFLHRGMGFHMFLGRGGMKEEEGSSASQANDLVHYSAEELTSLAHIADKKHPGVGELCLSRSYQGDPIGSAMQALDDVRGVEKRLREKLLHPYIDQMISGELPRPRAKEKKPNKAAVEDKAEEVVLKIRLSDFGAKNRTAKGETSAPLLTKSQKKLLAEHKEDVDAELTEGETIIWIGAPAAEPAGMAAVEDEPPGTAIEPDYYLYAITNRRVILWIKDKAPLTYYAAALDKAGLEVDERIPAGGSIILRRVVRTIVTRGRRGSTRTMEQYTVGILRIPNYRAVAQVLYDALLAPYRRS